MAHERCSGCRSYRNKCEKTIESESDLQRYQTAFPESQVELGDKFCDRCRATAERITGLQRHSGTANLCESESPELDPPNEKNVPCTTNVSSQPPELIEMPYKRIVSSETSCFVCGSKSARNRVTPRLRMQVFMARRLFVPKNNRCCAIHMIKDILYEEDLRHLRLNANTSLIDKEDLVQFVERLAEEAGDTIRDNVCSLSLTDEQIKLFTGLTYDGIASLASMLISMRNIKGRSVVEALVIFLFKMRTGSSDATVAAVFGLDRPNQVSEIFDSVIDSFEKDVLPLQFGFSARTRDDLIQNETSDVVKALFETADHLVLIFDGTYPRHERSANSSYQRKSYPGQQETRTCKPFTICTTTGYVVDILGPFPADLSDASIMENALKDPTGLGGFLTAGDVCFVDRGFQDVVPHAEQKGFTVFMPSSRGDRPQLATTEANHSRFVNKIRWAVDAEHGIVKQNYRIFDNFVDNETLPKIGPLTKIACFLNNFFGERLRSDEGMFDEVVGHMLQMRDVPNTLAQEVEEEGWNKVKRPWSAINCHLIPDFPDLTETDLKILFTGNYQLSQAVSYLAELLNDDNTLNLKIYQDHSHIIELEVESRHVKGKMYRCYIDYIPRSIGHAGIKRHYCECANGSRTVGCCSHVAAIVYYLSHGRYLSKILRPAHILNSFTHDGASVPIINEDSDED